MSEHWGAGPGRYAAAALIGLGLAALYEASGLPFGTLRQPGTGFFPILVAAAVVVFAALAFAERPKPQRGEETVEAGGEARVWAVIAGLAIYAGLVKAAGFIICTAALLFLLLRVIGRASWAGTAIGVVSGSIGCYWAFTRLGLPLPDGIFGF
ncbi:MAG: tripartite tricarboxylate transporter TctB family protein [Burkholderiales bacterium]